MAAAAAPAAAAGAAGAKPAPLKVRQNLQLLFIIEWVGKGVQAPSPKTHTSMASLMRVCAHFNWSLMNRLKDRPTDQGTNGTDKASHKVAKKMCRHRRFQIYYFVFFFFLF